MSKYSASKGKRRDSLAYQLGVLVLAIIVLVLVFALTYKSPVIPKSITSQANFAIFYPVENSQVTIEKNTFKYNKSLGQMSFIVDYLQQQVTFAEQSEPDAFTADPAFYTNFIGKLNGYATFASVNGRVDLTNPANINGQTGVMVTKGTLLFAKSTNAISESNWKLLFNDLISTQPK